MIRENRIEDALKFASEQLAERGEEDAAVLSELERTLALLAFEDPHLSPFSDLLSHSHRQKVGREANFHMTQEFHMSIKVALSRAFRELPHVTKLAANVPIVYHNIVKLIVILLLFSGNVFALFHRLPVN